MIYEAYFNFALRVVERIITAIAGISTMGQERPATIISCLPNYSHFSLIEASFITLYFSIRDHGRILIIVFLRL